MKRLIGIILSVITVISCVEPISVEAKVIEPEIVKTESWTTSYYIDDDMDTLYPYIQCEADIYNDGTIKLYMWNTHEWDGFATVSHTATIINTTPFSQDSMLYAFYSGHSSYTRESSTYSENYIPSNKSIYDMRNSARRIPMDEDNPYLKLDLSYYPEEYSIFNVGSIYGWQRSNSEQFYYGYCQIPYDDDYYVPRYSFYSTGYGDMWLTYKAPLPNMIFYDNAPPSKQNISSWTFKPTVDPTGTYNFRLFGHNITITPELLSGNIIAEPELTDQEKYIKQLEEENAKLKASITNTNLFGDINGDNLVDVADAQMILNYYVYTLANSSAEPLEEWISKQ